MKVFWTKESFKRISEIEDFIAKDSPDRAIKFINKLINRGESLSNFPTKGRIVPEFSVPEIREIIEQNYRIVYLITKTRIEILTVFEGHRLIRVKEIFKNK
jgi:toxin ParE1/3/4